MRKKYECPLGQKTRRREYSIWKKRRRQNRIEIKNKKREGRKKDAGCRALEEGGSSSSKMV